MEHFRETTTRFFDESAGENGKYLPAYPLIWNPAPEIENHFAKHYDVIVESYCDKYGWIGLTELGFYNLLQTYARLDRTIYLDPFKKKYKISKTSLVQMIDRLMDCELLNRVTRIDHRGYPNDLVLRPPKSPKQLIGQGYADFINKQVQTNQTKTLRAESRQSYCLDSAYSERTLTKALGRKFNLAGNFHEEVLKLNHDFFKKNRGADEMSQEQRDYVYQKMFRYCERKSIEYSDAVQAVIFDILKHYGRSPFMFPLEI